MKVGDLWATTDVKNMHYTPCPGKKTDSTLGITLIKSNILLSFLARNIMKVMRNY